MSLVLHSHSMQSTIFSYSIFLLFEIIPAFTHLPSLADFPPFVKWDVMYLALDPRWVNTKLVRNQWIFSDQIHINFPQTSPNNAFHLFYLPLIISALPVNVLNISHSSNCSWICSPCFHIRWEERNHPIWALSTLFQVPPCILSIFIPSIPLHKNCLFFFCWSIYPHISSPWISECIYVFPCL